MPVVADQSERIMNTILACRDTGISLHVDSGNVSIRDVEAHASALSRRSLSPVQRRQRALPTLVFSSLSTASELCIIF